jgi:hypothetical protein
VCVRVFRIVCDLGTLTMWRPTPELGCCTTEVTAPLDTTVRGRDSVFTQTVNKYKIGNVRITYNATIRRVRATIVAMEKQ